MKKQLLSLFSMKILHTNVGCKSFQSTLHVVNGCLNGNPKHLKSRLINNMFLEQILKKKLFCFKNLSNRFPDLEKLIFFYFSSATTKRRVWGERHSK